MTMKIKIRSEKRGFTLYLPIILCAIPLKSFLQEKISDDDDDNDDKLKISVSSITKELKKARKIFGHLKIVDIESSSGDKVEITL